MKMLIAFSKYIKKILKRRKFMATYLIILTIGYILFT
jgi:hypothetical protein